MPRGDWEVADRNREGKLRPRNRCSMSDAATQLGVSLTCIEFWVEQGMLHELESGWVDTEDLSQLAYTLGGTASRQRKRSRGTRGWVPH
jgi:hypothetical protein